MFTATVAAGRQSRGLTPARVDEVGRGHVWTGSQARTRGLVDEMGGVVAAVDRAAVLGGIPLLYNEAPDLLVLPRANKSILQTLAGMSDEASWRRRQPLAAATAPGHAQARGASGRPLPRGHRAPASKRASPSISTFASLHPVLRRGPLGVQSPLDYPS